MTMRERIANGKLFTDYCEGLPEDRVNCKKRMIAFNNTSPEDTGARMAAMRELFGKETAAWIEPPFYCCYGYNITIGEGSYLNFNCNFVDDGKITVGRKVMFGPAVTIATVGHPIHPVSRNSAYEYGKEVTVGDNVWFGGNTVVCPGVHIGSNVVIGAGSVVTKDIPDWCIAAGNPCRVIRKITEEDRRKLFRNEEIDGEAWQDILERMEFGAEETR